ncbi:hypothetical protein F4823DRAFT_626402 [Ustulina deusta]|nr:hypothetical protein F4823DRAFT_626402 [Ustulina deusta]
MAADSLPATLGFLTDAAHLLVSGSPETSAHLMSRRNSLMLNNHLDQPDVQRQRVCGCCGHIMVAGRGDVLSMESRKTCGNRRRKKKADNISPRSGCRKTLTCGKCGRSTTINFPPPACVPRRRFKQPSKAAHAASSSTSTTTPTALASKSASTRMVVASSGESARVSASASSKKRAKNRKQGLQALLQQSSTSQSQPGLGLSLADFMQN